MSPEARDLVQLIALIAQIICIIAVTVVASYGMMLIIIGIVRNLLA